MVGGLLGFLHYAQLGYMPEIDLKSAITILMALALTGTALTFLIAVIFTAPALGFVAQPVHRFVEVLDPISLALSPWRRPTALGSRGRG